jgi:hypothetical protein
MSRAARIALALLTLLALLASVCSCGGYAIIRAAEEGRLIGLSTMVDAQVKRGKLGKLDALSLARAVAQNEVDHARGPLGAERIRELQGCARHIEDALERRSEGGDPAAAAAMMVRVEAGLVPVPEDFVPWATARPGELSVDFRAVGARVLTSAGHGPLRRKLFTDGDQAVRLAALSAAAAAADPTDIEALLEAARLDPYPLARTQAIRAVGAIGGERGVLTLKDLWAITDEPARQAIADAWAAPRMLDAGGRRELAWASDTQRGSPAIAAAYALYRSRDGGDPTTLGVLERAIASGVARERIFAINVAPLGAKAIRAAILGAEGDPDAEVALAAASRLLAASAGQGGANATERKRLVQKLLAVAKTRNDLHAWRAKSALSRAGAREVLPLLDHDVHGADAQARKGAGMALIALGEIPRAAVAATDIDPRVRVPVSCAMLSSATVYY